MHTPRTASPRPQAPALPLALGLALLIAIAALQACGSGGSPVSSSGSPEADQRAATRVEDNDSGDKDKNKDTTLYARLGGDPGLVRLVDDITTRVLADPRVNFERRNIKTGWFGKEYTPWQPTQQNLARFKQHMVEFLTLATGGPAKYTGRDLAEVHKNMHISNTEFDAMVGDIKTSMDRLKYAPREKRELLAIIETTRKEIVEKQ